MMRLTAPSDKTDREFLRGKSAIVTGGSSGIGKELTRMLAESGVTVIFTSRTSMEKAELAKKDMLAKQSASSIVQPQQLVPAVLDLTDHQSVLNFYHWYQSLGWPKLDLLFCNAGVVKHPSRVRKEPEYMNQKYEPTFGIVLGHFLLTELLILELQKSPVAHVIYTASNAHHMVNKEIRYGPISDLALREKFLQSKTSHSVLGLGYQYGFSKICDMWLVNAFSTRYFQPGFGGSKVRFSSVHPGGNVSSLTRGRDLYPVLHPFAKFFTWTLFQRPDQGARNIMYAASLQNHTSSGDYIAHTAIRNKRPVRTMLSLDQRRSEDLYQFCYEQVGHLITQERKVTQINNQSVQEDPPTAQYLLSETTPAVASNAYLARPQQGSFSTMSPFILDH